MPFTLRSLSAALVLAFAGAAAAQVPTFDTSPETKAALQRLATEDAQVQKARWGDLAAVAGKPWLHVVPGDVASVWRHPRWVVPGAVMRYHRGFCIAAQCQGTDYLVQFNEQAKQLEFYENGSLSYTGRVQEDGSVRLAGTGLVGVLTAETLRFDAATGIFYSDKHEMKAGTGAQLHAASRGIAGDAAATAPAAAASAGSEAQLRAELEAMKAKVDALSRQVERQNANAPAAAASAAKPLTPAQAREAERRAQREAQAKAAEEKRLAAEAKAREEAQRKAEAQARAREAAEAKAAEAKRVAEEKKARQEAERRAAEEARAEQQRRVAEEKQRAADEKRAREEAARRAKEEQLAAKSAPAPAPAKTNACGGVDGVYGLVGSNYRIEVKFGDDMLMVREPNRDSPYRHLGQCQYGFTHPNGTEYRLGVLPRAMVAYKPGQSEAQKTHLTLLQAAAAPQANNACKGEEIPVQNPGALHPGLTRLFGTRSLPGTTVTGTYAAPEPSKRPHTVLAGDGTGVFEVYGAPAPQYVHRITSWHLQANCDGTLVSQTHPAATVYYLVMKVSPAYQGQEWHRMGLIVRPDRVSIDDRVRQ